MTAGSDRVYEQCGIPRHALLSNNAGDSVSDRKGSLYHLSVYRKCL